jgi:hypothetical protein
MIDQRRIDAEAEKQNAPRRETRGFGKDGVCKTDALQDRF